MLGEWSIVKLVKVPSKILGMPARKVIVIGLLVVTSTLVIVDLNRTPSAATPRADGKCQFEVKDELNVRSGPAADQSVAGKFQKGAKITGTPTVQNGFRQLADGKWASNEFLAPVQGSECN